MVSTQQSTPPHNKKEIQTGCGNPTKVFKQNTSNHTLLYHNPEKCQTEKNRNLALGVLIPPVLFTFKQDS